jgi:hypothetical protein
VLRWCASNAAAVRDTNDNVRPDKARSSEKIDGITALVIALSRMILTPETPSSIYETQGITFIGAPEPAARVVEAPESESALAEQRKADEFQRQQMMRRRGLL